MEKTIKELESEVYVLAKEVHELQFVLRDLNQQIKDHPELIHDLRDNLLLAVDNYKIKEDILKKTLESYFKEEDQLDNITNFTFKKLYKRLTA